MNQRITYSDMLFQSNNQAQIGTTNFNIGQLSGNGIVSAAHNARTRSAANRSKICTVVHVIAMATSKQFNCLQIGNGLYAEIDQNGDAYPIFFDGVTFHINPGHTHLHKYMAAVVWACYYLSDTSSVLLNESKALLKKIMDNIVSGLPASSWEDDVFRFCDAFYYETVMKVPNDYTVVDDLRIEEMRESVRTNNYRSVSAISDYSQLLPDFREITLTQQPQQTTAAPIDGDLFNKCKAGQFVIDPNYFDIDRRSFIPKLETLDTYIPNDVFCFLVQKITKRLGKVLKRLDDGLSGIDAIKNDYINIQLAGHSGSGKSTLLWALGATLGLPTRVFSMSKYADGDDVTGKTKVCQGGFTFFETPFLDIYKNGGIIILEEYNLADGGILQTSLGQVIEKPFFLLEDEHTEVHRHPLCIVATTSNPGTEFSRMSNQAFINRLPNVFTLDDPKESEFVDVIKTVAEESDTNLCKSVYRTYRRVLDYLKSSKINRDDIAKAITLRHCIAAVQNIQDGASFDQAIEWTIIGTIGLFDTEEDKYSERVRKEVLMSYNPRR